ncbi:glycosyltransferase family 2 protein [uncultured Jannaschia sp.]|uniref:glycosyltransferase family 2 protein n=1 Tax=uncultured Jannaschia sp. TaxID=293347 RepID=UPI00260A3A3D|nr:glycosyltransferase family 2 protein [uncultured Jannaschia sp.]
MFETRILNGRVVGDVTVLDAVGDPDGARVFLGRGLDPVRIDGALVSVNGSVMARVAGGTEVAVPVAGCEARVPVAAPEPDLFAGLRVMLGCRNGESVRNVRDWLDWHAGQGADAALILDRTRPGESPLAPALGAALSDRPVAGLTRVIVVTSPVPLGGAEASERHPLQAPDAPGKDRMDVPAPDPWTAPLAELVVLEALRWRFLTAARAVAFLDVSDLLAPAPPGRGAFARIDATEAGILPLHGRRIYPWRLRKGRAVGFGDHVCTLFDTAGGHRRWIAAPARLPADAPFRLTRIGRLQSDTGGAAAFHRAMALRCNEAGDRPLAPKSGLVRSDALLHLSRERFGHDPVLPPVSAAPVPRLPAALPGRTAIVTCMRNEGPFILEWIAHHRGIGVDDILIYTNDCTDGTVELLDALAAAGIVTRRDNPFPGTGLKPQHAALAAAEEEAILARAGWAICMDVDEFIDVHAGQGRLADLYAAVGDANMISMTWRLFGNDGRATFEDVPVTQRFTACAPEFCRKPHQAWGFKTLFRRNAIFRKMGVHRPKGLRPDLWRQVDWVNGSGRPMPREMLRNSWRSTAETYGYDLVTLKHYAVRDAESFLVKRDRGRVNHVERDQGLGYWFRMNNNAERDLRMQAHAAALADGIAELRALPGVAAAHDACVRAHRARIAALKAVPANAAFLAEITGPRLDRLSRMHAHFGANVFLAGPGSVPDAVTFADHPPDFFFTVEPVETVRH